MNFGTILLLSVGLSMDAMTVSAARGLAAPRVQLNQCLVVALVFGGFQALMPAVGWFIGAGLGPIAGAWDHWIAFALLAALGGKMLWEALAPGAESAAAENHFDAGVIIMLGIATSIDALAAGISLPVLRAPLVPAITTIGITTAVLSVLGLLIGRQFGKLLGKRLDLLGGIVLIGIGGKILLQHLAE